MPERAQLPFDPIEEARRHWTERPPDAAAPMLLHFSGRGSMAVGKIGERIQVHRTFGTEPLATGQLDDLFATLRTLRAGAGDFAQ